MRLSLATIFSLVLSQTIFANFKMVSMGDSISVAFNATDWGLNENLSWSVGDGGVSSHYERLVEKFGDDVDAKNLSKSGATSDDLARQADAAAKFKPDYATLLIGGNDLCHKPSTTQSQKVLNTYKANVEQAVDKLIAANGEVKVLLVPVPDLYHLWQLGKDSLYCRNVWRYAGVCAPLLSPQRTDAERASFVKNLADMNQTLVDIAKARPANVKIDPALGKATFEMEEVSSLDCFHPSEEGQALISRLTWESGWY